MTTTFYVNVARREESLIHSGDVTALPDAPQLKPARLLLVLDACAFAAHRARIEALTLRLGSEVSEPLILPGGEGVKDLAGFPAMVKAALERRPERGTRVLVVGGGAVLDAGQFLAAVLLRGLECVVVPTTLLAQVDAGLGGKCGLDAGSAKNQIGVIRQPRAVLVDPAFLASLPPAEIQSGLGEMCKMALLEGGALLEAMRAHVARGSSLPDASLLSMALRAKARCVSADAFENGRRIFLNLGHTIGHALEALALEAGVPLGHGVAVALGLRAETRAFNPALAPLVDELLDAAGLPRKAPAGLGWSAVEEHLVQDKKVRDGVLRVPVLGEPGRAWIVIASIADCAAAARTLA